MLITSLLALLIARPGLNGTNLFKVDYSKGESALEWQFKGSRSTFHRATRKIQSKIDRGEYAMAATMMHELEFRLKADTAPFLTDYSLTGWQTTEGQLRLFAGNWAGAKEAFQTAASKRTRSFARYDALVGLARIAFLQGQGAVAFKSLREAEDSYPEWCANCSRSEHLPHYVIRLAWSYAGLKPDTAEARLTEMMSGQFPYRLRNGMEESDKRWQRHMGPAEAALALATLQVAQGRLEEARFTLQQGQLANSDQLAAVAVAQGMLSKL